MAVNYTTNSDALLEQIRRWRLCIIKPYMLLV